MKMMITAAAILMALPVFADSEHPVTAQQAPMMQGQQGMMNPQMMQQMRQQRAMNPQMMQGMMGQQMMVSKQAHMAKMEGHMAGIDASLKELVELQRRR
ncbi:MAG: hypothetical protein HN848_02725 [Thiotrichales bacterium]|nr:hypothetical protein [Thiotrichales bacterium]MBT4573506.1 hypothetical protein [Thiotrichales bacterium]MBT5418564.1 hypothetical protein [Thiotrichales bacterium]MBT7314411.1 hypothetical protein [Thiotrichales bacterium]